ncbi:hypothetical protein L6216_01540 [Pseudomonas syringae pv. syringae]|uniref:hypothetical protein n=1 Tax=Pseudomonas syringae TaxID=317 RepID=UPI001F103BC1|nr:hypothetical protein [Pseudomonas syringae]MCH5532853.1 hypothetical protein [Pseudomonas syringae pv. syringae]
MTKNWEQALISVVERELARLEWLIKSECAGEDDIERGDVHAQIDRICSLTNLGQPDGLPVSETTGAKMQQLNEAAMSMVRARLSNI